LGVSREDDENIVSHRASINFDLHKWSFWNS
jgi:hypothetical protein